MDNWLQNNTFVRVFSILLAALLWFVVSTEEQTTPIALTEHKFNVSVTYQLDETQYAIIDATKNVDVILNGNPADIRSVLPGSLKVVANLTELGQGSHDDVPIVIEGVPRGVTASARPSQVTVEIARKSTIELPVQIVLQGTAAAGFVAGQPIVSPNRIFVTATQEVLDKIFTISAQVNINNAQSLIDETVRVRAIDSEGKELDVSINPAVVDVIVPVSSPFKELPISIHYDGDPAIGFGVSEIVLSANHVTVFGPMQDINGYEFFPGPEISLNGLKETTTFEQPLALIHGTTKIEPGSISITVEIEPSENLVVENIPIIVNGIGDDIMVNLEHQSVDITLEATPDRLQNINKEDIQVFVDVSNLPLGAHQLKLHVNTPRFVKAPQLQFNEVTVNIERAATEGEAPDDPTNDSTNGT